jgi:hypothetical protein
MSTSWVPRTSTTTRWRCAARRVARLRRPSISAWAANQLAHAAPHAMADLLDAGAALQQAQQAALASQPDAARGLRTAGVHLRAAITRLTQRAETLLHRAGHAASDATLSRLAATPPGCRDRASCGC